MSDKPLRSIAPRPHPWGRRNRYADPGKRETTQFGYNKREALISFDGIYRLFEKATRGGNFIPKKKGKATRSGSGSCRKLKKEGNFTWAISCSRGREEIDTRLGRSVCVCQWSRSPISLPNFDFGKREAIRHLCIGQERSRATIETGASSTTGVGKRG